VLLTSTTGQHHENPRVRFGDLAKNVCAWLVTRFERARIAGATLKPIVQSEVI